MFLFRWISRTLTVIVVLALIAPAYGISQVWRAANNPVVRQADVSVVLGAAQLDGRPGEALEGRLVEAKRISISDMRQQLLLSVQAHLVIAQQRQLQESIGYAPMVLHLKRSLPSKKAAILWPAQRHMPK